MADAKVPVMQDGFTTMIEEEALGKLKELLSFEIKSTNMVKFETEVKKAVE